MKKSASLDAIIVLLKAVAEVSHLRVLRLLNHEDLTIPDFIFILDQSQACILRNLCLLYEARLIGRYQKEGCLYFKLCHDFWGKDIVMSILSSLPKHDMLLAHDLERLKDIKKQRQKIRKKHFLHNTSQWDVLRSSYVTDHSVENALLKIVGDKPFQRMLNIGIGGDSLLKLFSDLYTHAVEVVLDRDILHLPVGETTFDLVILHWVLHFLENPEMVLHKISDVLRPHGRLLIVDFCYHKVQSSHPDQELMHLGFSASQIEQWLKNAGLVLEQTICLTPIQSKKSEACVVTIWLARDPRLLVDDIKDKQIDFA
ncbi:methyltransferase domain-containing protein [Bartonella krasnovii]|uniref:SAM-dependent methyltransferase n=1 Tax=Bartonella krasnovii TaxID=2267275 RepID=A0A5B9D1K2_9HYPH|nr:methyltransferase domain-containing protein [Bartonella krasnovii]QEE12483.1 SAM-dependent methyltransferase [Bartonella krasnovii]UNF38224.1 methyltransferase domain-containing protein [Bartonella krasnovii]UNF39999.1 methyltransferase domain-containing protein [Bartonella krasnovii]UNF41667.1 methyltransferase domain-containing protein [Bartonella krasnovii]UNF43320.1 methyltransferase domain-containing protein [Bartonella krasnovii]